MNTIEQLLKDTIAAGVNLYVEAYPFATSDDPETETVNYTVTLSNDVHFHDKNNALNVICGLIKTGQGQRSNIPGFTAVQSPFQILFECDANFTQKFLGCLSLYIASTNGVVTTVTDTMETDPTTDDIDYSYRLDWMTPVASGSPYPVVVKSLNKDLKTESQDVMMVLLRGTITYSSGQSLNDRTILIEGTSFPWEASNSANWNAAGNSAISVNGATNNASSNLNAATASWVQGRVLYDGNYAYYQSNGYTELKGITSYAEDFAPVFGTDQAQNSAMQDHHFETYSVVYAVVFTRDQTDALHTLLASIPHSNIASNTADVNVNFRVTSLSVNSCEDCKITKLSIGSAGGFETVTLALTRDE